MGFAWEKQQGGQGDGGEAMMVCLASGPPFRGTFDLQE